MLLSFLLSVAVTAAIGAVIQTQFNLAALESLGVDIPWSLRLDSTLHDLLGFTPVFAILVLVGFLCAFPVAGALSSILTPLRAIIYALAGVAALYAAFMIINSLLPMPTLIAATRTLEGLAAMSASGALGGYLYARLTKRKQRGWDSDIGMRFR
ncbi:hypothetical protein NFC81_11430 [Salinispirillum sp. LH 10-3-1]|uniref:Uncharacterized protein n=1 Tax=Salinispirillum sp. LH 10-3-1 TaxID=2952525 RepID=A0AB38YDB3_9GAMM